MAAAAIAVYLHEGYPWWLFVALILAPDLSMIGYAGGLRVGAAAYNAAHTYAFPVVLVVPLWYRLTALPRIPGVIRLMALALAIRSVQRASWRSCVRSAWAGFAAGSTYPRLNSSLRLSAPARCSHRRGLSGNQ